NVSNPGQQVLSIQLAESLPAALIRYGVHCLRRLIPQAHEVLMVLVCGSHPFHTDLDEQQLRRIRPFATLHDELVLTVGSLMPQQVELRQRQRSAVREKNPCARGSATISPVKFIYAKLPNRQRLQDRALAAVVPPNEKVEVRELVGLRFNTLEVLQRQPRNHVVSFTAILALGLGKTLRC